MKKFVFLFAFVFYLLASCTSQETTTYYLIRHSEKDRSDTTNRNPNLNKNGQQRAKKWAAYFKDIHLDAVYSTNYNRTMQTATPTAESKNLEIKNYDPRDMFNTAFKKETKGKTVLVVGHSNTTPAFVNKILGEKKYEDLDDNNNATLFTVIIKGNKKTSKIEEIE
ncbi:histidine phosphatase family protein [Polaribacter batillariae]|uniref:Histidine phosphatase family protein n=1 Tax=Polaribacter batillariae TaxID=2808900 RepID=A0ABX7STY9_9FLAO|nr:phosphoglycerate mutase family protein [Polaribacter batillariae]QTD37631.1 histidine phosphatase family protein [Polaribacter batillariae]